MIDGGGASASPTVPGESDAERAAGLALASLQQHALGADPAHVAVWYAYHLGQDAELRAAIDGRLASGLPITSIYLAELHRRFLSEQQDGTCEAGRKVQAAAESLLTLTSNAGEQIADFGRMLTDVGTQLAMLEGVELRLVATGLLQLTQSLAARTEQVSERLARTESSVEELRRELAVVNKAALSDPLTGIGNRRAFDTDLDTLLTDPRGQDRPPTLLVFDIDHFKRVNDSFGHPVGDALLRFVGLQLRTRVRPSDRPYRLGGEEFAVLLPATPVDEAVKVAERIRVAIAEHDFKLRSSGERIGRVTLSCGAAERRAGEGPEDLFARADAALYAAKAAGRDQVVVARSGASSRAPVRPLTDMLV